MSKLLPASIAALLGACAFTSSSPFAGYDELPRSSQRHTVGLWDLGDRNCKGSIQTGEGSAAYWVVDCQLKLGYGHCTHGLPLVRHGPGRFATSDGRIVFTVQDDGQLDEVKDGRRVERYAPLEGQICGASRR